MKNSAIIKTLLGLCALGTASAIGAPVQSVLFQGDYGGNSNSAIGTVGAGEGGFHYFQETDINGDSTSDAQRFVPLLFPYVPELGIHPDGEPLGPKFTDFGIDESLFGVNSFFYIGTNIVNYSSAPGDFLPYGLYRYNGGADSFQLTSGNVSPSADMGLLAAFVVIKKNFLNGSKEVADLKLPNEAGAFTTDVSFRGRANVTVDPAGVRTARFIIRAGDTWYISETGTEADGASQDKVADRTLSINPATDYWHEYDETNMSFMAVDETGNLLGTGARGDTLSNITATGVIIQNSRFDGTIENHTVWMQVLEFGMKLDPDPTPVVETGWVDTGDWLGQLYDTGTPWAFSELLNKYIYLPEGSPGESGGWAFVPAAP